MNKIEITMERFEELLKAEHTMQFLEKYLDEVSYLDRDFVKGLCDIKKSTPESPEPVVEAEF